MWSSRALLLALALSAGLVFQAPAARGRPPSTTGSDCPPSIVDLSATAPDQTVTCRGWSRREFVAGTAPADVLVRSIRPEVGMPCRNVHYYRVTIVGLMAIFAFAGGAARGTLPLTAEQAGMVSIADAYVTDEQLGTDEPYQGALTCALDPTYHFTCPTARGVDQFCLTWVRRSHAGVPG